MKSYIQGFITGGVFVFAFMVLTGSQLSDSQKQELLDNVSINKQYMTMGLTSAEVGTYQIAANEDATFLVDTRNGHLWSWERGFVMPITPFRWRQLIKPE